ncbi:hypothetical protein HDV02_001306 [Globomyces sp. JEL0801]|nr:hypothetical protein HDV02_001306 [Globomyces sp. JEL0801]
MYWFLFLATFFSFEVFCYRDQNSRNLASNPKRRNPSNYHVRRIKQDNEAKFSGFSNPYLPSSHSNSERENSKIFENREIEDGIVEAIGSDAYSTDGSTANGQVTQLNHLLEALEGIKAAMKEFGDDDGIMSEGDNSNHNTDTWNHRKEKKHKKGKKGKKGRKNKKGRKDKHHKHPKHPETEDQKCDFQILGFCVIRNQKSSRNGDLNGNDFGDLNKLEEILKRIDGQTTNQKVDQRAEKKSDNNKGDSEVEDDEDEGDDERGMGVRHGDDTSKTSISENEDAVEDDDEDDDDEEEPTEENENEEDDGETEEEEETESENESENQTPKHGKKHHKNRDHGRNDEQKCELVILGFCVNRKQLSGSVHKPSREQLII